MKNKRTPHSSKRTTKKSKKNKRDESTPKAVRFPIGVLPVVEAAVKIAQKALPDSHITMNSFIVSATLRMAKAGIAAQKQQFSLFPEKSAAKKKKSRKNVRLITRKPQRVKAPVNKNIATDNIAVS